VHEARRIEELKKRGVKSSVRVGKKEDIKEMTRTSLWGLIQNRLYGGSYDSQEIEQNFSLTYIKSS
jgi:hypothetical protein